MLTESELEAIEKRLEAATPGPWKRCASEHHVTRDAEVVVTTVEFFATRPVTGAWTVARCGPEMDRQSQLDADLIANAPTDIARLLADLKLYKAALEESISSEYWIRAPLTPEDVMPHHPALATILKGVKG